LSISANSGNANPHEKPAYHLHKAAAMERDEEEEEEEVRN
jgi:hypothetical protein